jgi:hypothetical protein
MYHPTAKLVPKQHRPFSVVRVLSPITYELRLPTQWKLHPVFHVDLLTPYRETEFHGANYNKPPPDLIEGEEEYEGEKVLASRHFGRGHKLQYLIKWKGYPDSDNQWVAAEDVFVEDAIRNFQSLNSNPGEHLRQAQVDDSPHHPLSECPLPGLHRERSGTTSLTSTQVNSSSTSSSIYSTTSPTSTDGNIPASAASRAVFITTSTKLCSMIIPEPPFTRYANTHDSIGCANPLTEEEAAQYGVAWPISTHYSTPDNQVAVCTNGTPIIREEVNAVMQCFPTPTTGALGSPEPESP